MKTCIKNRFLVPVLIAGLSMMLACRATAQTFTTLHSFTGTTDGATPDAGLILSGNTLYGTAAFGGASGYGTVFAVNTDGTGFTVLHSFTGGGDGTGPTAELILSGNTLYGTTVGGGSSDYGTVFKLNTDSTGFAILHSFTGGSGGNYPVAGLILSGNTLYGTTSSLVSPGHGTVFAVNTDGADFKILHTFTDGRDDGALPLAGLILSGNTLYGTTFGGGSEDSGTVFAVNTDGTGFKILHSFIVRSEGGGPEAGLILSGNTLYGTANRGGSLRNGTLFAVNTDGTGFTILHSFAGFPSDGANLYGGLILSGNTLYGTTSAGGSSNYGTVFKLNTDSTGFTILHSFIGGSGGAYPAAGLILSCNTLYGTADGGGSSGAGTVFKLDITVGDIESLICLVETFNFTEGIRSSLDTKLQHAQAAIESGDFTSACPNLRAFINEVQAQAGKKIPLSQASQLITAAEQIKAVVGCP